MNDLVTGQRIKKARFNKGISQKSLAALVEISPSYLNMIEGGKRPVAGALLGNIASELDVTIAELLGQKEVRLQAALAEIVSDLRLLGWEGDIESAQDSIQSLCADHTNWVEILLLFQQQASSLRRFSSRLNQQTNLESQLGDIGHQILQHLTTVKSAAEILQSSHKLGDDARARFGKIIQRESGALEVLSRSFFEQISQLGRTDGLTMVRHEMDQLLHAKLGYFEGLEHIAADIDQTMISPETNNIKSLAQWVRDNQRAQIEGEVQRYAGGKSAAFEQYLYHYFEQYLAAALAMPYRAFLTAAANIGYDLDGLAALFGASIEQVAHRLISLKQPDGQGIAFAFMRTDAGGNIIKAFSTPEFHIPTFGATCPRWPIYLAAQSPGETLAHRIEHDQNGSFLALSRTEKTGAKAFGTRQSTRNYMLVCRWEDAHKTVYGDSAVAFPINAGTSCSVCRYPNCPDRLRGSLLDTAS